MNNYQLIVIGAGPGGYVAALKAAKLGMRTAVVECRDTGGTCLNRGCIPTKAMLHASELCREARSGGPMGIQASGVAVDLSAIYAYKQSISQKLSSGIEGLFHSAKVDLLRGTASIVEPGQVQVADGDGAGTYTADHILIATGSAPAHPPIPGLDLPGVLTSDELLAEADHLPRSIVIIGGGVIGVEFATFYNDLGCQVTIVEGLDRLLPNLDRELGQNLAQLFKKRGVTIHTNAMVQQVLQTEGGLSVDFSVKTGSGSAEGEMVLCAIGRRPYLDGLFPGDLQPEMDGRFLRVNERFETSIPGIYAVGDVSSKIQLAHVASAQGEVCVELLCGRTPRVDLRIVPSCVYCRPEIASVGLTEAEAKESGISVKTGKCVLFSNARTMIVDPDRSFIKLVAEQSTHRLLGAQLMCPNATDLIDQFSQAIANGLTAEQLLRAMRPHPTFSEALTDALEDLVTKLTG